MRWLWTALVSLSVLSLFPVLPLVPCAFKRRTHVLLVLGTGEHGVGVGKKEYLVEELGEGTVDLMKRVKDAVDPKHIMNPGKVSLIRWGYRL